MTISTLVELQNARVQSTMITSNTSQGSQGPPVFCTRFAATGEPQGTLAGTSTTAGVVPTSASAGYPRIKAFSSGNVGYIKNIISVKNASGRMILFDRLWVGGAYNFNANVTLTGQPSYASRVPNSDYSGLELWLEIVTSLSDNANVQVTYTNESGVGSRTATMGTQTNVSTERVVMMNLQSGDSGIQRVDAVTAAGTVGTFNVMVLRRIADINCFAGNVPDNFSIFDNFFLEQIYDTSALYLLSQANGVLGTGLMKVRVIIAEG